MKFWLLTTEYPPFFGGGIGTYAHNTARMMADRGDEVTVFVPGKGELPYAVHKEDGVRVVQVNLHRTPEAACLGHVARQSYEFALTVRDLIRLEGKPDVIESQEYLGLPYFVLQFKALRYPELEDVPVLLSIHAPAFLYLRYNRDSTYRYPNYWTAEMEWSCIASADRIIAPSHYILDEIRRLGPLPEERTMVLRYPFAFTPAASQKPPLKRGKLVFWGKLSPQKGVFELLRYMSKMWDNGFPYDLTVYGGKDIVYHPEMRTMGQLLEERYGEYIKRGLLHFAGKVHPSEIEARFSDAHVVIIPSTLDNFPFATIEALALGNVVLGSQQAGHRELIRDGETGFLFDHNDPGTFEKQLQRIMDMEEAGLRRIGEAAAAHVRDTLGYDLIYGQKRAVLEEMAATKSPLTAFRFTRPLPVPAAVTPSPKGTLLSVVIPFYNMATYIRECVDSIKASQHQHLEIIIVDDGSKGPENLEILMTLESEPGIRVLHQANGGLAHARNVGASVATGEYLAFLDADDTVHPGYYRKAIRVLEAYDNVSFVGSWVQYFGTTHHTWAAWNPELPYALLHNPVCSGSLVYKRQAFLEGGLNDRALEYGLEDYDSVLQLLSTGHRGVVLPETLFRYRIRKDSMMRNMTHQKQLYTYQHISHKYPELYRHYAVDLFNLFQANGPSYAYDNPTVEITVTTHQVEADGLRARLKQKFKRIPGAKRVYLTLKAMLR
ncbi:glycosyltransferase [Dinghuibacter silviterrae]|uniref:Glycosyltransferase involved in cell wall biosynthesis n=1 Tax=Dinghuibacter silviterrae TaxID=1539049 RepID=A0A4R8DUB9_9BACT|nr:glycosyltransferase [Dinghuibacter silviterrae]TDX01962.1 glycosyltransferase involved in cell wall biosynthesis [Dinghuibacter silviterrae]